MYNSDYGERRFNIPMVIIGLLLVGLGIGFLVYYFQTSSLITTANTTISNLNNQIKSTVSQLNSSNSQATSLSDQLTASKVQIGSLTTQITNDNAQLTSLNSQLAASQANLASVQGQVSSLQNQLATTNTQIPSLQTQLATANAQVTTLQSQLSSANSQVTALQSQVNSLTAQLAAVGSNTSTTGTSTQIMGSTSIAAAPGTRSAIASFTASVTGYISITGYSSTAAGYIMTTNSSYGNSANYTLNTASSTFSIPVQPGTISVYFGNSDTVNTATAYITNVVYYATASTTSTTSNQIVGSTSVTTAPGVRTPVATFTASAAGYISITGYGSTANSYIMTTNSSYGNSANYLLGTASSTFSIPVQPGSVTIYFGNNDAANATAYITNINYYRTGSTTTTGSNQIVGAIAKLGTAGVLTTITTFTADVAGYINFNGYCSTDQGYMKFANTSAGTFSTYPLTTTSSTLSIPVQPGSITISYFNNDASGATATLNITSIDYVRSQ